MQHISLQAAVTLTEWSERTIRRRLADGSLLSAVQQPDSYKNLICFESIRQHFCIPLVEADLAVLAAAENGDAAAQTDLAVLFLENDKPKSALYWLEAAAKQNQADAIHLLGCCYLQGQGVGQDDNNAIMWIAKAASYGHKLALAQIQSIYPAKKALG
jgi:TPR repeat protein